MPPQRLYLNDFDMSLYGMWAALPVGWADAPTVTDTVLPVPGHAGRLLVSREADIGPREVALEGTLMSTAGALRAQVDAIKLILASPLLEVRFAEWPDRYALARYRGLELRLLPGHSPDYGVHFTLRLLQPNPYLLARQVDVYTAVSAQRVALVLGSAPSDVLLYVIGTGLTAPTVTYLDRQGLVAGSFAFDLVDAAGDPAPLPTGEWIDVDSATMEMRWHKAGGVVVNAVAYLNATSVLFTADPHDGDGSQGPVLLPSNCSLVAHVRRAWL